MIPMVILPIDPIEYEEWWEYNDNGNLIHYRDSNGNEKLYDQN